MLEEINKLLGRKEIHVYRTHIEIFPYKKNENYNIQKLFSKYNFVCRKYEPIAYTVFNNKLYIPRIADIGLLEDMFKTRAVIETEWDLSENISKKKYAMTCSPRSKTQEDAIAFLTSDGRFHYTMKNAQYGLNLDTGKGKTYCTINAILQSGLKAIIVLPRTSIKEQWVKTFDEMTNVPLSRVKSIDSSEEIKAIMKNPKYDFYMINHQLLITFGNKYGWDSVTEFFKKIGVGIKVYDESHKFFSDTMMIDFFTNTKKSIYLTATFARSDYRENIIYQLAYSNMNRFGEETKTYKENRKHIIAIPIMYSSNASYMDVRNLHNKIGSFSSYKFIDYAIGEGTIFKILESVIHKIADMEGRILVTVPKIESTEVFADKIREIYADISDKEPLIMTINSKNTPEENKRARADADVIVSTIKSVGEGDDIKKLRAIINFEPIGSWNIMHQLRGRLREYDSEKMTFLFYPIDTSIAKVVSMYKQILPDMQENCSEILETEMYDV